MAPTAAIASDRAEEARRDREPAALDPVLLEPVDGRVQREREEDRDEDPDEDRRAPPDDLDQHDRREDDPEHDEDRARAEADETLLHVEEPTERRGQRGSATGPKRAEGIEPS